MNMHEGFSSAPKQNVEKKVSDLSSGSAVLRNGEVRTIVSYRHTASGVEMRFDDGDIAMLDADDTLEVPPAS